MHFYVFLVYELCRTAEGSQGSHWKYKHTLRNPVYDVFTRMYGSGLRLRHGRGSTDGGQNVAQRGVASCGSLKKLLGRPTINMAYLWPPSIHAWITRSDVSSISCAGCCRHPRLFKCLPACLAGPFHNCFAVGSGRALFLERTKLTHWEECRPGRRPLALLSRHKSCSSRFTLSFRGSSKCATLTKDKIP